MLIIAYSPLVRGVCSKKGDAIMDEYRFNSETEPTDEQLQMLMQEAGQDVRESNEKMRSAFFARINQRVSASL